MLKLHRISLISAALALPLFFMLYATLGVTRPLAAWQWMHIVSKGGMALLAGVWLVLSSRSRGQLTELIAGGLGAIMLGAWADCLGEIFAIDQRAPWGHWLPALLPLGMLVLSIGIYCWRQQQRRLTGQQQGERRFQDQGVGERITQLADASYLRTQIRLEQERRPGVDCALVLLDIDRLHLIQREHGQHEGERVLQAVGHMLLLNLRNDDLLCLYAGERYAVLMPGVSREDADLAARHLCDMVGQMRHHAENQRLIRLRLRHACALSDGVPEVVLAELSRAVETPPRSPMAATT